MTRGYHISVTFGDNSKYDLIVDVNGELFRVQCKTAWKTKNGTIRFNAHSQTTKDGEYHETGYAGEIDAFGCSLVRYPGTDTLYWVDVEDVPNRKMEFRYTSEIDHPAINWAKDFELGEEIPTRD